jgi:hypothetical protein
MVADQQPSRRRESRPRGPQVRTVMLQTGRAAWPLHDPIQCGVTVTKQTGSPLHCELLTVVQLPLLLIAPQQLRNSTDARYYIFRWAPLITAPSLHELAPVVQLALLLVAQHVVRHLQLLELDVCRLALLLALAHHPVTGRGGHDKRGGKVTQQVLQAHPAGGVDGESPPTTTPHRSGCSCIACALKATLMASRLSRLSGSSSPSRR